MTKIVRFLSASLAFVSLVWEAGCTSQPVTCKVPPAPAGALASVETGNAQFATDMLAQLAQQQSGKNFFYSPYSISAALAMTYQGAGTQTAQQMAQVLHLSPAAADVAPAFAQLDCQIETDGQAGGNRLDIANALFGQQGFAFQADFLSTLQSDYGAPLQQVDFVGNASGALQTINQWVSDRTQGVIPQLLAPGNLAPSTLVLADAIYFKGAWATAFDPASTTTGPFLVTAAQQVQTPLMNQTANFGYATGSCFSMLELTYMGGQIAMDVLLPDAVDGLPALLGSLTAANFASWVAQLHSNLVEVTLPKLKVASSFDLKQTLSAMGMPLAFDRINADFSGIDGQHDLSIGTVVHKATLEVDESGTVAAAATATEFIGGAMEVPVRFNASHPFLLVLRDLGTGTLLFIGQVTDPTQS